MATEPIKRIVVVDDEKYIGRIIVESLAEQGYDLVAFTDPEEALEYIAQHHVDLVLTDLLMGDFSGTQVLDVALENHSDIIVVLMTAHPTVKTAISVLTRGAYDFHVKPFKLELLKATVERGLAHQKALRDNLSLRSQVEFLKTANNCLRDDIDLAEYFQRVLKSCNMELSAEASAIVQVQPESGEILCQVAEAEPGVDTSAVLALARDTDLFEVVDSEPRIASEKINRDGNSLYQSLISKPILIGERCHGIITLQVFSKTKWIPQGRLSALSLLASSTASAIANHQHIADLKTSYLQAIKALANAIEARDHYTAGHTDRVTRLAEKLARRLGWSEDRIMGLRFGCTLHDIGKIGVPDHILNKTSRLTPGESRQMRMHPMLGLRIIQDVDIFKPATPYIMSHHERYDGKGYPNQLKGKDIPIEGRLLAVVDTFDAIISDRPYRQGASLEVALGELIANSGTQFDPDLVTVLIEVLRLGYIDLTELYGYEMDLQEIGALVDECLASRTSDQTA